MSNLRCDVAHGGWFSIICYHGYLCLHRLTRKRPAMFLRRSNFARILQILADRAAARETLPLGGGSVLEMKLKCFLVVVPSPSVLQDGMAEKLFSGFSCRSSCSPSYKLPIWTSL